MTPDQQSRLWDLFSSSVQNTLTEPEFEELQTTLRTTPEARQLWYLHQDLSLGLNRLLSVAFVDAHRPCDEPPTPGESSTPLAETHKVTSGQTYHRRKRSRTGWPIIVLTAIALTCFWSLTRSRDAIDIERPVVIEQQSRPEFEQNTLASLTMTSPTHGTTFRLEEHRGKMIALHFLLQSECPFCLKLTHDYTLLADQTPDVLHLFIKPDREDDIKSWAGHVQKDDLREPPVIYRDRDAQWATAFQIPDGYQFHGSTGRYPALVLIDKSGMELFRYVGKDNTDRMAPADFMTRLAQVSRQSMTDDGAN